MKQIAHSTRSDGQSLVTSTAIATGIALLVTALLSALLTSLTVNGTVSESASGFYIYMIRALAVLLGGLAGTAVAKKQHLLVIGLTALMYLIVLLGLGIVLYDGSFKNFGIGLLSVVSGSVIACIIKMKPTKKQKRAIRFAK